jgi:Fic family protein
VAAPVRARREVLNYFAALRHVEKQAGKKRVTHEDLFRLHAIIAGEVMDQGEAGRYRTMRVRVGPFVPPPPEDVSGLMFELLEWWNKEAPGMSPVLSSAIVHHRFETIHPFADGNGRTGRALALWELYRRGFDSHHLFAVDEFYWEDRPRYYAALDAVRREGDDLTSWLEYCAEGLQQTLERVWCHRSLQKGPPRVETPASKSPTPLSTGISGHYGLRVFKRLLSFQWFSVPRSGASPVRDLRRRGGVPDGGRAVAGRSAAIVR